MSRGDRIRRWFSDLWFGLITLRYWLLLVLGLAYLVMDFVWHGVGVANFAFIALVILLARREAHDYRKMTVLIDELTALSKGRDR